MLTRLSPDDQKWLNFVADHPDATVFHQPGWIRLLAECYGYRPFVLASLDTGDQITAGLPVMEVTSPLGRRRWVSLPFTDYCPPLVKDELALGDLADELAETRRGLQVSSIEVRWDLPERPLMKRYPDYLVHELALKPDPEAVFSTFSKKFRQYPRKAERDGLRVTSTGTIEDIQVFYGIHLKTRRKLGVPVQPARFFNLLWKHVIAPGYGRVLIVSHDDKPVSGAVVLKNKSRAAIKYSASDPGYLHLRCHYFTFWKSIEWACLQGPTVLDFGKTESTEEGLRFFKDGWGASERALAYSIFSQTPLAPSSGGPPRLVRDFIRLSPPWVCRAVGELLYGYFA